jgi:hypothetical protein
MLVVAGLGVMAYAVFGLLTDRATNPGRHLAFAVGLLIAHDAVFLPLVLGAGALVGRWVPEPWRTPVRVGGVVSLALAVVAAPFVLGYGRRPDDPSALPLDYGRGLLVLLAVVWAVTLGAGCVRLARRRRSRTNDRAAVR